jgi:hypothetical protein
MRRHTVPTFVLLLTVGLAACGESAPKASGDTTVPATVAPPLTSPGSTVPNSTVPNSTVPNSTVPGSTAVPANGGWIGGEPDWSSGAPSTMVASAPADGATAHAAGESAATVADIAPPGEPAPREGAAGPLQAGSVDDNVDFDAYLAYLDRISSLGIPLRQFRPDGRIVATVTGDNGLPVHGAEVIVSAGLLDSEVRSEIVRLRTTSDGTVRFFPEMYPSAAEPTGLVVSVGDVAAQVEPGQAVELLVPQPGGAEAPIPVDVLFLLDATGSMSDEIDRLKSSIDSVALRVAALEGLPDVRFAMTLYRDEGDEFVTATHDFTSDVDAFRAELAKVIADGGGDYPEALDEGLAEALAAPAWRDPAATVQLVFLVADAPPQVGRQVRHGYDASILDAVVRGLKIFPVASSESDDQAEAVFRQLAQATGGRFVFLTYGAGGAAATGGNTDIDTTDYEELALDDLVVRLIAEELAALTGDESTVPPPTPTSTTTPDGQ